MGFGRSWFVLGMSFFVWAWITLLVMLAGASRSAKRGRIVVIFVVSVLLYVFLVGPYLVWAYET